MGFKVTDAVFKALEDGELVKRAGYSPLHQLVLLHLGEWANNQTGQCWYSISSIAKRTWISPNHVRRIVRDLERDGILHVAQRPHRTSIYTVCLGRFREEYAATNSCNNNQQTDEAPITSQDTSLTGNGSTFIKDDKIFIKDFISTPPPVACPNATLASPIFEVGSPILTVVAPPTGEWSNPLPEPDSKSVKETRQETRGHIPVFPSDDESERRSDRDGDGETTRAIEEPESTKDGASPSEADMLIARCYEAGNREPELTEANAKKADELLGQHRFKELEEALAFASQDPFWGEKFSTYDLPCHFFGRSLETLLARVKQRNKKNASKARRAARR